MERYVINKWIVAKSTKSDYLLSKYFSRNSFEIYFAVATLWGFSDEFPQIPGKYDLSRVLTPQEILLFESFN